jgi:hypothetical protein
MAQSRVHHFLARARDSGEDLTGLACLVASTGMGDQKAAWFSVAGGVFCAESAALKTSAMEKSQSKSGYWSGNLSDEHDRVQIDHRAGSGRGL